MNDAPLYFDHNATTPVLPQVVEAMLPFLREHWGNPSSDHSFGRRAHDAVEEARSQVATLIGAAPEEIVFTSGGTESNNLALLGSAAARPRGRHLLTSVVEHPATANPCNHLEESGWSVARLGVDAGGQVDPDEVASALRSDTSLVSVMHANNETGVIQPISEIADLARAQGALVHTDAAQSVGKVRVKVDELGADYLTVAGHKLYAPKGVGALYVRRGAPLMPVLRGAGHEGGRRPGTENVASVVGLGIACEVARSSLEEEAARVGALRDRLWELLSREIPALSRHGDPGACLPNTLNLGFPGVRANALLAQTPALAASTGSACHSGTESPSAVLLAMGVEPEPALGAVRLSLGRGTTKTQVDRAASLLTAAWREMIRP